MYTPQNAVYIPQYKRVHQLHSSHRTISNKPEVNINKDKYVHYKREANRPNNNNYLDNSGSKSAIKMAITQSQPVCLYPQGN